MVRARYGLRDVWLGRALGIAYARTQAQHPFECDAIVVLPDHLHALWTLPPGDADFSTRWRKIKARFSRSVRGEYRRRQSKVNKREVGLWQRRFWEHCNPSTRQVLSLRHLFDGCSKAVATFGCGSYFF
ncbi:REP-associated tyrosine transposase [Tateyamaria omphalii]|uniref:Transposase IS200-like domain-containing protein n=1 Tax=Tateyamaria omphalii TaxID=299262 RepID=A0A1P8MZV4_9RHOB|nr:transposase [Tateyamaria omphalii]APX13584.1 hypothetical protein BWR18_19255 [Tateyamaria omphalii]